PDYCDPSLCFNGQRHVACNASSELDGICAIDAELLTITEQLQSLLTDRFNELRDAVAQGGYNDLEPAARMATLTWDPELSHLAEYNVQKCYVNTDDCVNTKKYKQVGQIVGYRGSKGIRPALEEVLNDIRETWVRGGSSSSMTDVINNDNPIAGAPKYSFLQMLVQDAKHVGCAVLQQFRNGWLQTFFTCNFDVAPSKNAPIYEVSKTAASSCQSGTNKVFKHLCSEGESYSKAARTRDKFNSHLNYGSNKISNASVLSAERNSAHLPKIHMRSVPQPRDGGDANTGEKPADTTGDKPADSVGDKPADTAQGKPGDTAQGKPGDTAGEKPADSVGDKPADAAQGKPGDSAQGKPGDTAQGKPTDTAQGKSGDGTTTPPSENGTTLDKSKLLKKFDRFLKLIKNARLNHQQRKIIVITSNHEVQDSELR
ncbi:hypothetical protein KR054_010682, partial [Drosophila jambulina]